MEAETRLGLPTPQAEKAICWVPEDGKFWDGKEAEVPGAGCEMGLESWVVTWSLRAVYSVMTGSLGFSAGEEGDLIHILEPSLRTM